MGSSVWAEADLDAPATAEGWRWPSWSLDHKKPQIEVYVHDPDSQSCWVAAVPRARIVDSEGRDAYLCAEYDWAGDRFSEDFGPERVRRIWERRTVWETVTSGRRKGAAGAGPPVPPREDTRRSVQSTPSGDSGRGVCSVCLDAPGEAVLSPCLHGGLCEACATRILELGATGGKRCPHCRTDIDAVLVRDEENELRPTWVWPKWCRDRKAGYLEVKVTETGPTASRWVAAMPIAQVVDKHVRPGYGGRKYLCAEYLWDGELYQEDFGPDRVRRKGDTRSLLDVLLLQGRATWRDV